jgi:hypothetical protein
MKNDIQEALQEQIKGSGAIEEAIAHGQIVVCNCEDCQKMPLFQNAPTLDLIKLTQEENEGKSERTKR